MKTNITLVEEIMSIVDHAIPGAVSKEVIAENIIYILVRDWGLTENSLKFKGRPWEREESRDE